MTVASPCINLCKLNERRQHCVACLRTLDEIRAWSKNSDQEKLAVWARLQRVPTPIEA
ncbi:DUF1289 domain-containing protein [Deefgea rivuli]|uniref:DUF1289 domain-containing protein n=1 Tax=Deefgea rivuli TaxID=400948 RepID=UPI0009FC2BC7